MQGSLVWGIREPFRPCISHADFAVRIRQLGSIDEPGPTELVSPKRLRQRLVTCAGRWAFIYIYIPNGQLCLYSGSNNMNMRRMLIVDRDIRQRPNVGHRWVEGRARRCEEVLVSGAAFGVVVHVVYSVPIWRARALPRSKLDRIVPRTQRVN